MTLSFGQWTTNGFKGDIIQTINGTLSSWHTFFLFWQMYLQLPLPLLIQIKQKCFIHVYTVHQRKEISLSPKYACKFEFI